MKTPIPAPNTTAVSYFTFHNSRFRESVDTFLF